MPEVSNENFCTVSLTNHENTSEKTNPEILGLYHVSDAASIKPANSSFSLFKQGSGSCQDLQEVVRRISSHPRPSGK